MTQYGFYIDLSRCIGCNACVIACKQWNNLSPGPTKWMRVHQWETGAFPDVKIHLLPVMCFHCEKPICVKVCPNDAISKESKYGAVLVDADKCVGCRKCWRVCPYGAPQFEGDEPGLRMSKCTMCFDRLEQELKPICVLSCSMRALEFGPLTELEQKYGTVRKQKDMPRETITHPTVIFSPQDEKKQVIPWDSNKSLNLWQKRQKGDGEELPDVFNDVSDITQSHETIIGRNKLVLKAKDTAEFMYYTTDDE